MNKTVIMVLLLLLCPAWAALGQQSGGMKISVQGGEPGQGAKEKDQPAQSLTNDSIIKLVRAGLGEDTIISMVNTQPGKYFLGADYIIGLKLAGVSEKIITVMLNKSASAPTPPPETPAGATNMLDQSNQPFASRSLSVVDGNAPVPKKHGFYYQDSNKIVPIEGQVISFARSGSLLSSTATFGIKSRKINVQILGERAAHTTGTRPVFHYRAASGTESAGGSAGDLVLVRMSVSHSRRQFEVGAGGAWRASSGISIRSQLPVTRKQIEPDLYELTPDDLLKPGQYGLYLFRGYDLPGYVYDFSVE